MNSQHSDYSFSVSVRPEFLLRIYITSKESTSYSTRWADFLEFSSSHGV